jgi:7-cyano-7-deazaguanine synthase in queuosine biosynthesis
MSKLTTDVTIRCRNYLQTAEIGFRYGESFRFSLPWRPKLHSPLQSDLLRVAGALLLADRAFRRQRRLGGWVRTFWVRAALDEPQRWSRAASAFARLTSFLTGDNWSFEFVSPKNKTVRIPYTSTDEFDRISGTPSHGPAALFSGGLDSFCGASKLLRETGTPEKAPLFLSSFVTGRDHLVNLLQKIAEKVNNQEYIHLLVHGLVNVSKVEGVDAAELPERSRRSRSLYFLLQAMSAALEFGNREIYLYENGVMALNLPIRADDIGSRATRHAHPFFLQLLNEFSRTLMGREAPIVSNPFAEVTKGEMILKHANGVESLVGETITCWGYPNATNHFRSDHPKVTHCGRCLPCLIRRVALRHGQLEDNHSIYGFPDLFIAAGNGFPLEKNLGKKDTWSEARKLLGFAQQFSLLKVKDFHWRFGGSLQHLTGRIALRDVKPMYNLYTRFSNEVKSAFSA